MIMNFSEKIEEIQGKVKSYNSEIKGMKNIPSEKMIRVMMAEGEILEPCMIIGESDEYIDLMVVDLDKGPVFTVSIKKERIVGFGTFHKPLDELAYPEEELNAVPAALYL
ncbi:hypothetical protein [Methanobrevibacter ruminantium]|nr:hypothetical protein [Methanobrevibacter ruminantium]